MDYVRRQGIAQDKVDVMAEFPDLSMYENGRRNVEDPKRGQHRIDWVVRHGKVTSVLEWSDNS